MLTFLAENWRVLLPSCVGLIALLVYYLQEERRKKEAASLIVLQINDLSLKIREVAGYINAGRIDCVAFYESLPIIEEDYWNKNKHYFVNDMDFNSFSLINEFYSCALEIQEQQMLCKELQKKGFLLIQKSVNALEYEYIKNMLDKSITENVDLPLNNVQFNVTEFWNGFDKYKEKMHQVFQARPIIFTNYIPIQIAESLEKLLKKCALLTIIGCSGYKELQKRANSRAWLLYFF